MLMGLDVQASPEELDSWDRATRQVHWPIGGVLASEYAPALRQLGLSDPQEQRLGRGGFGEAFQVNLRGRKGVLKLTRDPHEVVASWMLRSRKTQHVVPIFEVWSLPKLQRFPHWASWWCIHREYLRDFSDKDGSLLETIYDFWKDDSFDLSVPKPGDRGRGMREKWRQVLRHETSCSAIERERSMALLDQISKGIRELGAIGIDWSDILPDNLLRDASGALRISDVGFGLPRRDIECEPPELTAQIAAEYASG